MNQLSEKHFHALTEIVFSLNKRILTILGAEQHMQSLYAVALLMFMDQIKLLMNQKQFVVLATHPKYTYLQSQHHHLMEIVV